MAAPIISPITSILDYLTNESWSYQPFTSGSPTSWRISPAAPPGMSFNTATGMISGQCVVPGVYVCGLYATNGDGESAPSIFPVAIGSAAHAGIGASLAVAVDIDLVARTAKVAGVDGKSGASYQHAVRYGDDLTYHVRFFNGTSRVEPPVIALAWAMKNEVDEEVLNKSSAWRKVGYGTAATWAVTGRLDDNLLLGEVSESEADEKAKLLAQQFIGTIEFEWLQDNAGGVGSDPLRGSAGPMPVLVSADYQQIPVPEP